jgi:hypothetical protein
MVDNKEAVTTIVCTSFGLCVCKSEREHAGGGERDIWGSVRELAREGANKCGGAFGGLQERAQTLTRTSGKYLKCHRN